MMEKQKTYREREREEKTRHSMAHSTAYSTVRQEKQQHGISQERKQGAGLGFKIRIEVEGIFVGDDRFSG